MATFPHCGIEQTDGVKGVFLRDNAAVINFNVNRLLRVQLHARLSIAWQQFCVECSREHGTLVRD